MEDQRVALVTGPHLGGWVREVASQLAALDFGVIITSGIRRAQHTPPPNSGTGCPLCLLVSTWQIRQRANGGGNSVVQWSDAWTY